LESALDAIVGIGRDGRIVLVTEHFWLGHVRFAEGGD